MHRAIRFHIAILTMGVLTPSVAGQAQNQVASQTARPQQELFAATQQVGGKTLEQWAREIRDNDAGVRQTALENISKFGLAGRRAGRAIISQLTDRDPSLRANAAYTLSMTGVDGEDVAAAVTSLDRMLSDSQAIVRFRAATALGTLGPLARDAIPHLITTLRDQHNSWEVRKTAAFALGSIGRGSEAEGPNPRAMRALCDSLRDPCGRVRLEAVVGLIAMGKPVIPGERMFLKQALRGALKDREREVSIWAEAALMKLDKISSDRLDTLARYLKSPAAEERIQAIRALAAMGPEVADSSVPELIELLNDREPEVVGYSIQALTRMGPLANSAIPSLQKLSTHDNPAIRQLAQNAVDILSNKPAEPVKPATSR